MAPKTNTFFDLKTCLGKSYRHSRPPPLRHNVPHRLLSAKVIDQMVKSRYLVDFPAQKKEPKWFENLGRFKKNSSCSVAKKKSLKNWTGPCLSLNMVRRNRFIKWQTPSRNVKSSFEGANPTPPTAQCSSGDRLPERRSYHVLWGALDLRVTKLYF